jgi:acyl-CoA thioester hydrolase
MPERFVTRMGVRVFDIDAQGHLTGAAYLQYANHALWECVRAAGVDVDALLASGVGPVNLETNIRFLHELRGGDQVEVSCHIVFAAGKTYRVRHEFRTPDGDLAAEVTAVFGLLDLTHRRLVPDPRSHWLRHAHRPSVLGLGLD